MDKCTYAHTYTQTHTYFLRMCVSLSAYVCVYICCAVEAQSTKNLESVWSTLNGMPDPLPPPPPPVPGTHDSCTGSDSAHKKGAESTRGRGM